MPAFKSVVLALVVEVPLCIFFSIWGAQSFAYWLSASDAVAGITGHMWKVREHDIFSSSFRWMTLLSIDNRLVLYILRRVHPISDYPPRDDSSLVPLPKSGV